MVTNETLRITVTWISVAISRWHCSKKVLTEYRLSLLSCLWVWQFIA